MGKRLDVVLPELLEKSRSNITKHIKSGDILVGIAYNEKFHKKHHEDE